MSNIIEELFYGNLEPQELTTEITPRLKKKLNELVKKEEELAVKLYDEEKEKFANYVSTYNEFSSMSICDGFVSGFRFGARFTYDTFVVNSKGGV